MDLEEIVEKYSAQNVLKYGKGNVKSILGKVLMEKPELKKEIKYVIELINKELTRLSSLSKDELKKIVSNYNYSYEKKQKDKIQGPVTVRFAPEPSGYMHIGHAKVVFLNKSLVDKYGGNFILRFDDTNPNKESWEYVKAIKEDLEWLGISWKNETYTSDYMEVLYRNALKLIEEGKMYVCLEPKKDIEKMRRYGIPVKSRNNSIAQNLELWDKIFSNEFKEGEVSILLKSDLHSKNTALRDPTMFRIIETPHYKQGDKYILWPTYDFAISILDSMEGVTHAIRSKEYELRGELYYLMLNILNLKHKPELIHISRLNLKDGVVSKRYITPLVKEGKVWGWDDPRLSTLRAFKRKGIVPKAIEQFVLRFGFGKQEKTVTLDMLLKENRKVIDPISKRLFAVEEPVRLKINSNIDTIFVKNHPTNEKLGKRQIKIGNYIFISKKDYELIKNDIFRLKDFANAKIEGNSIVLVNESPKKKIQWVSKGFEVKFVYPKPINIENNLEIKHGIVEENARNINIGEIIQFERMGFFRKDDEKMFIFSC